MNRSICVYCGSSDGIDPRFLDSAYALGEQMADRGYGLVFGGGMRGLMGAVAQGVKAKNGHVTGIIPEFLLNREKGDGDASLFDAYHVVQTMHERKHMLFDKSDAFVALPGGIGTLEEIVEIMTWAQLGHHEKPMVFASIQNFWSPMERLLSHMSTAGFIHSADRLQPITVPTVDEILPAIEAGWSETARRKGRDAAPIEKL
ncbi:Rossman fold protein, TIGR00730 family [Notoacmeibacter marinus]|uniref:Cytokinin riboside 5'-monophosphate phosphoribohydrolase n=1 Tax=Notoacmeibacter marinus TaxID=1876515 RepID=A0A231UTT8_9HYPH|nr:TIGR00730 family Rossman fold protein [Notoacmeibacter marinus]OXS99342.1 Rossman fold protein, TIGR00730 family [Notoacmeibacter marinus]